MSRILLHRTLILAPILLSSLLFVAAQEQSVPENEKSADPVQAQSGKSLSQRYRLSRPLPPSASQYYALMWGVDSLAVKSVESGEIIRFTYRVLDVEKAKVLNDKKNEPSLIAPGA